MTKNAFISNEILQPRRRRASATYALSIALALIIAFSGDGFAARLESLSGGMIDMDDLEAASTADWLLVDLNAGEKIEFFGAPIYAKSPARIILVTSSEDTIVAVVDGKVMVRDRRIRPGKFVAEAHLSNNAISVLEYDAELLARGLDNLGRSTFAESLTAIAKKQRRALFWGLLQRTSLNATYTYNLAFETGRRAYISDPAIIRLKRQSAGSSEKYLEITANKFIIALKDQDADSIESLLDPRLFLLDATLPNQTMAWRHPRRKFAETLARRGVKSASPVLRKNQNADQTRFTYSTEDGAISINLSILENTAYVFSIR